MNRLLIVYHSLTGGTRQMAQAASAGAAQEPQIAAPFETAANAMPDALLEAQGCLFACPENLAAMSGVMKDFFDRSYYRALDRIRARCEELGATLAAGLALGIY